MATFNVFSNAFSDVTRFVKSRVINVASYSANPTLNLIRVPKYAFVTDVILYVTTVLSGGTPALTLGSVVGVTTVVDDFMISTIAAPATAGMKHSYEGAIATAPGCKGKYFSVGSGIITATLSGTPIAGVFYVFIEYKVIY